MSQEVVRTKIDRTQTRWGKGRPYEIFYVVIILIMRHVKLDEKLKGFSHEKMAEKAAE